MKSIRLNEENSALYASKCGKNHVTFLKAYRVIYLGYAVLDKRYTLPMLPWVIAEIRRHGFQNREEIFMEVTKQSLKAVKCESNELIFEHKLQIISKFAQSSHDSSCFTYMTREVANGPCAYHVFQADDEETILELFTAVKEATKEITNHQNRDAPVINKNECLPSMSNCQQFEVLYVGRMKVSGKRPPPSFVDDAVEKFRIYEAEKARNFKNGLSNCKKSCSSNGGFNISSLPESKFSTENGLDSCANVTKCNTSHSENISGEKLNAFNHVYCDNSSDSYLQSPLSPLCRSDPLQAFTSLKQPASSPDRDVLFHPQKEVSSNNLMPPSSLITHTQSLDVPARTSILQDLRENDLTTMVRDRVRSCSGDIPRTKQSSLPAYRPRCGSGGTNELTRPRAFTSPNPTRSQQNRIMLFIIGPRDIYLLSMDKKQILLNKTFNDIAHCSQGVRHLEHFGFISRETTLTGANCYAGYIFRCQTERVVDEIMSALKQAFKEAHLSYQSVKTPQVPNIVVCDECPMNWFHLLCSDLEGLNAKETHLKILHKLGTLPDCDKEEIMVKFQKSDFSDVQEQNEILMMLLREYCEQKQIKHSHSLLKVDGKNEVTKEKHSRLDSFRQKAKKTVSNSFETFLKLTNRDEGRDVSSTSENNLKTLQLADEEYEKHSHKDLDTHSYRESSYSEDLSSLRLSPLPSRPRSSTFSSPREKMSKKAKLQHETPKKTPIINMFMKSRNENSSQTPSIEKSPRGAWRQAIFHRVQTPVSQKLERRKLDSCSSDDDESKTHKKKSKEELRALWKKAIIEQILLIRMEKENKKLQDNQDAVSHKRMKLNYKEITPCLKASVLKWEDLLNSMQRTSIDRATLTDMVKSGVPRHKRGEIWQFLSEYAKNEWNNGINSDTNLSVPYDELLKQLTSHQHSILIDIGRTFPNHPFYSQSLGSGQLSLFNLLKAYSLMDKEVGYCQGLSFVAGILLLHMPEEQAFFLLKYLMFDLGLRRQYKTDMVAFQIQMYQLSRLIHDNYPDLYDHLEKYDIAPTLYAAPWFLTLFASQFPVGFVSRLFDLIFLSSLDVVFKVSLLLLGNYKNEILSCDSFETIMDYLKTVLPSIDVLQMEIIFNQVFNLDISRQLHAYEVEYHVLLEEMIHSPSQSNPELENLQIANKNLKAQNMELMDQLQVAYSRIHSLEASEASLKSSVRRLETRVSNLEEEKEALEHSLSIMKKRLERLEVARIEGEVLLEEDEHPPPFKVVYALAGSEKEEDERFRKLMRKISQSKKGDTLEEEDMPDAGGEVFERTKESSNSEL